MAVLKRPVSGTEQNRPEVCCSSTTVVSDATFLSEQYSPANLVKTLPSCPLSAIRYFIHRQHISFAYYNAHCAPRVPTLTHFGSNAPRSLSRLSASTLDDPYPLIPASTPVSKRIRKY